jgi:hypothetical protein
VAAPPCSRACWQACAPSWDGVRMADWGAAPYVSSSIAFRSLRKLRPSPQNSIERWLSAIGLEQMRIPAAGACLRSTLNHDRSTATIEGRKDRGWELIFCSSRGGP